MTKPKLHRNAGRGKPTRAQRRKLMAEYDIPNSGRQWRNLKKQLQRAFRKAKREQVDPTDVGRPVPPHRSGQGFQL